MYLVVGATGILGSEICRLLAADGKPVKGLVRATSHQTKVDELKSHGVEIVRGDMCDPASLEAACQGVNSVISTVSSMPFCYDAGENDIQHVDLEGVTCLIDAAKAAGSWVSFKDVAQFAVASLDNPAAQNATLELGGPEALSPLAVVRIFEEVGGRPFEVEHVPEETIAEQQKSATDPMQQSFAGLMRWYAKGDPVDMAETLKTFPVQLTSVRDSAQGVLAAS